jgi:uncharacterized protein (DUF1778 family)
MEESERFCALLDDPPTPIEAMQRVMARVRDEKSIKQA